MDDHLRARGEEGEQRMPKQQNPSPLGASPPQHQQAVAFHPSHLGASSSRPRSPPPLPGGLAMDKVVSKICGREGGNDCNLIAKCVECSSYLHRYCTPVVKSSITLEWLCYECQQKDNGDPRPKSEVKSLGNNIGMLLIINLSEPYSRRPSDTNCWTGCFLVHDGGTKHDLGEFKAYLPSTVSHKAYDITNMMPSTLQLDMLPRMDYWPKTFETSRPIHQDIGLFFLSKKFDSHQMKHSHFLETCCNYVMRAYINDIKLLIYSSEVLPPDSQWIDGESYLWGVFVRRKGKRSHRNLRSTST